MCSSGSAKLVFYRECYAFVLGECSACVLQGLLSLCSTGSPQLMLSGSAQFVIYRECSTYVLKGYAQLAFYREC
jgi:hypothetical protein